jgi:RimJ/RimL family protein N-acetyltransferase
LTRTIRRAAADDADLGTIVGIVNAVSPEDATSIEELRWADATYPGGVRFIAELDGRRVGVGTVGRIYMHPPEHMTAVLRRWRGRGLASALKGATIAWAIDNAFDALITGNDVDNAPMRAVNARLGYRPTPGLPTMRGPLLDGIMVRS